MSYDSHNCDWIVCYPVFFPLRSSTYSHILLSTLLYSLLHFHATWGWFYPTSDLQRCSSASFYHSLWAKIGGCWGLGSGSGFHVLPNSGLLRSLLAEIACFHQRPSCSRRWRWFPHQRQVVGVGFLLRHQHHLFCASHSTDCHTWKEKRGKYGHYWGSPGSFFFTDINIAYVAPVTPHIAIPKKT